MFFRLKNKSIFKPIDEAQLKARTRILFIDDSRPDVIESLSNEGWRIKHIYDLDRLDNTELIDSHIVCIDIKGVGVQLGFKHEGLDVVKAIKEQYPNKRIILYSSIASHDIFHEALRYVDKRVYKDGQAYPFLKAIRDIAKQLFDWDEMITDIYNKYRTNFSVDITRDEFSKKMRKAICGNSFDLKTIVKITGVSLSVASEIVSLGSVFFK